MRKESIKICLLGASFHTRNMGVSALASGTFRSARHCFPKAEIFVLDYVKSPGVLEATASGEIISVREISLRFSWRLYLRDNIFLLIALGLLLKLLPFGLVNRTLTAHFECLRLIREMDIITSIAGGDSFGDLYGLKQMLYVTLPQTLVLLLGKRLILLPQTYGPFDTFVSRRLASYILRGAFTIYSRDLEGIQFIRDLLKDNYSRTRFAYDMGFALESIPPKGESAERIRRKKLQGALVGLNVSGLLYMGGYSSDNMFKLKSEFKPLVENIVAHLIQNERLQVLLVPHVFGSENDTESDVFACQQIYAEMVDRYENRLMLLGEEYNQHEIRFLIGQCDLFIGARMHACIAALSQGVPAVALAYSDKFIGVMESIGMEDLVADLRLLDGHAVMRVISRAFSGRDVYSRILKRKMIEVQDRVMNLFTEFVPACSVELTLPIEVDSRSGAIKHRAFFQKHRPN